MKNHPNGNIFQTPEMYEIYLKTMNYEPVLVAVFDESSDELIGTLLAVIQKEHKGVLGNVSSRAIIIGGPLVKDNDAKILKFILEAFNEKIKKRAVFSQFRNLWDWKEHKIIFEEIGFMYDAHLDILINLNLTQEELNKTIKREKRRNLTKSRNKGVTFEEITGIDDFKKGLELIKSTYQRIKLPMPNDSFFLNAYEIMNKSGYIKIFGCRTEDEIIGIRMTLNYKGLVYDWYAGSDYNFKNMYPNDFLIFEILLWGLETEYKTFDFGGAGKPNIPYGVRDHKMKFGGELVEFGRFEKVHKPKLMYVAKAGLELYKLIK